jgi:hypothetical protein
MALIGESRWAFFLGAFTGLEVTWSLVGAGLPAMVVDDNACEPDKRGVLESIAGKPAPTGIALSVFPGIALLPWINRRARSARS